MRVLNELGRRWCNPGGLAIVETLIDPSPECLVRYYLPGEYPNDDPGNRCAPTASAVELGLREAGFARVEVLFTEQYRNEGAAGGKILRCAWAAYKE